MYTGQTEPSDRERQSSLITMEEMHPTPLMRKMRNLSLPLFPLLALKQNSGAYNRMSVKQYENPRCSFVIRYGFIEIEQEGPGNLKCW